LIEGEEAYLARLKQELDRQRVEEVAVTSPDEGLRPLVPETIDGGVNYTRAQGALPLGAVTEEAVSNGEVNGLQASGEDNSNQGTLFHSDEAVGESLIKSASKVIVGPKAGKRAFRTVSARKKTAEPVVPEQTIMNAAPVGSGATAQHDALR
jgi:hypothetical protein